MPGPSLAGPPPDGPSFAARSTSSSVTGQRAMSVVIGAAVLGVNSMGNSMACTRRNPRFPRRFGVVEKVSRRLYAPDTRPTRCPHGPERIYCAGHQRGTRNRKTMVSTAKTATATMDSQPLMRLSATVPNATNAATEYMPRTALRCECPISSSR